MALHSLGKLHAALVQQQSIRCRAAAPKAMVFYQAALLCLPANHLAANDLGVLMARCGDYGEARASLEHSLAICSQSTGWHNLAVVCRRLGDTRRAAEARQRADAARRAEATRRRAMHGTSQQLVRWVNPETFAQSYARTPSARQPMPPRAQAQSPQPRPTLAAPVKKTHPKIPRVISTWWKPPTTQPTRK